MGCLANMGNYMDALFGSKLQVFIAGVVATVVSFLSNALGAHYNAVVTLTVAVFVLYVVDMILGMLVAWREGKFSSKGFATTFEKLIVYAMATLGMTAFGVVMASLPCVSGGIVKIDVLYAGARLFYTWCILLIGFTEFVSIIENLGKCNFSLPVNFIKYVKTVKDRLFDAIPGDSGGIKQ